MSLRHWASRVLRPTMLGQKLLLYNPGCPRVVNISPIDEACFYRCVVCPFSRNDVRDKYCERREMNLDTLRRTVKAIPNDPFYAFDISAFGETLTFDGLVEFVEFMKIEKPRVPVTVSTNGLLLRPKLMKGLIKAGLDRLQVSLFAHTPAKYKWITGTKVNPGKIWANIEKAMAVKREMHANQPEVQVFILGIQELEDEFDLFLQKWEGVADKAFIRPVYNACMGLRVTPTHEILKKRYACVTPWYSISINANGDVGLCYFHNFHCKEPIGNVNEQPLLEIWKGEEMEALRWAHWWKWWDDNSLCAHCDLWAAYSNIWDEGKKEFFQIGLSDLFRRVPAYRGG